MNFVERLAGQVEQEVEHVDALIQQNAAASQFLLGPPCVQIVTIHTFAVAATHPENGAELAGVHDALHLVDCTVLTVIETVHQHFAAGAFDFLNIAHILSAESGGLFAEDVLASLQCHDRFWLVEIVGQAKKDNVDVRVFDDLVNGIGDRVFAVIGDVDVEDGFDLGEAVRFDRIGTNLSHFAESANSNIH